MLRISCFHTLMTPCSKPCQTSIKLLQFIDVMNLVDLLLHFSPSVSSMTQMISGANVSVWVLMWKHEIWAFDLTPYNACFILPTYIIFVNFVNIKEELLHTCSRHLPVLVFCVLQGIWVTWHVFCCKFNGKYDGEKNLENKSTFVKHMNECIVAQSFLLRHVVNSDNKLMQLLICNI